MKSYYSCLDTGSVQYVPQPVQHLAIADRANKIGGKIIYYTMEDFETLVSQGVIKSKIKDRTTTANGIIFFSLRSFCYGEKFNFDFLKFILDTGYEVHFAKENVSIPDRKAFDKLFPMLYTTQFVLQRDSLKEFWQPIFDSMDSIKVKEEKVLIRQG